MAFTPNAKQMLCNKSLIQELVWNNLRRGAVQTQEEVRQLLCVLTRDNPIATEELCSLLMERINLILKGHLNNYNLGASVRHEIALMAALVQKEDDCWELKLRYLMRLFLEACDNAKSTLVMESVILPCLKILLGLMKHAEQNGKKGKEKGAAAATAATASVSNAKSAITVYIDVNDWLQKKPEESFDHWKKRLLQKGERAGSLPASREEVSLSFFL